MLAFYIVMTSIFHIHALRIIIHALPFLFYSTGQSPLPSDSQGIIFLNIDSYLGGVPLWSRGIRRRAFIGHSTSEDDLSVGSRRLANKRLHNGTAVIGHMESFGYSADAEFNKFVGEEQHRLRLTECNSPSSCQDGLIDVISVKGTFHLGQIRVGIGSSHRICQCREVKLTLKKKMAVQNDGEPWMQRACTIRITRKPNPMKMLHRASDDNGGLEAEVSNLLEWAEEHNVINGAAHST